MRLVWRVRPLALVTVFVDDMYLIPLGYYRGMHMSHMIASDEDELHAMAKKLNLRRQWYQGDHYDIAKTKRAKAIALGVVPITLRQCSAMRMIRDRSGVLPLDPIAAEQLHRIWLWARMNRS